MLLVFAGAVLAGVVAVAPPGSSQPAPSGRVSLASQTPWVPVGGTLELRVDIAGVRRPEAVELAVTVHAPVTSRSQFQRTLEGALLGSTLHRVPVQPLSELELDAAGAIRFDLDLAGPDASAEPGEIALPGPGVYPVQVALRQTGTGTVVDRFTTHLVRQRDDDAEPLAVAWVQPFGAPPALRPDGMVILAERPLQHLTALADALTAFDVPLTLTPRPETLDALAAEAPETLTTLAGALEGRQVVAGPYVDVDVDSLVATGLEGELALQRDRGARALEDHVGVAPDVTTWVSDRPLTGAALDDLAGVEALVLPEEALVPLDRPLTLANPFVVNAADGRARHAVVADAGLSAHLVGRDDDDVLRAHHLLADLAVLAYDAPGLRRGVVVRPPPAWEPSPDFAAAALEGLGQGSVVRAVTLEELFRQVPTASTGGVDLVRDLASFPPEPLDLAPRTLGEVRQRLASLATMAPQARRAEADVPERLLLVAQDRALQAHERHAYVEGARRLIEERLNTVTILSQGSFRLTSREATIPLTLVNHLDVDLRVSVLLQSEKLDFAASPHGPASTGAATLDLTLEPGNNPVAVPVEARTSGDFPLVISVRSPDGELPLARARLTVRSTFLSGVGILLSAGAGLFLAVWWGSHWRTTRRDRRLVPSPG